MTSIQLYQDVKSKGNFICLQRLDHLQENLKTLRFEDKQLSTLEEPKKGLKDKPVDE
jgi:hypothetical protein